MNDEDKAKVAQLKRKAAALKEQGAAAKAAELMQQVNAMLELEKADMPAEPTAHPNPHEAGSPKVADTPKTAAPRLTTRRDVHTGE